MSVFLSLLALSRASPFPDSGGECQPADAQPNWPIFHIVNNVTKHADGSTTMEPLNDANAIFSYKGLYHVMNQAGGGNWTHAISNDLVHWFHIDDALGRARGSSWDYSGPCDGTASFPNLGGVYDGTVPIIMYGPDCGQPVPPSGSVAASPQNVSAPLDAPRVEPAMPRDPADPYLRAWVKTQPGPVKFEGTPCSFPGRVWKSKKGTHWNMLCALDGKSPWARYESTDANLMSWRLAAPSFTRGVDKGAAAGALFHKIPNAKPEGPQFMINANTGTAFYLGSYDSQAELMTVTSSLQEIESGSKYHWAASGNDGPDPEADSGRLLTVAWVSNKPSVLSLIRELKLDHDTDQLVSYPVAEYSLLRNSTFVDGSSLGEIKGAKPLPVPAGAGGALDLLVSFDSYFAARGFGVSVRSGAFNVTFDISASTPVGLRTVRCDFNGEAQKSIALVNGETLDVRVLVDRPLVEVFVQRGRAAYTFADTSFSADKTAVLLFNDGPSAVVASNVSAFGMGCGWATTLPVPKH